MAIFQTAMVRIFPSIRFRPREP